jgi:hypothetical protein
MKESSSPNSLPASPRFFSLLPTQVLPLLHGFLGFTSLMDLRCLSRGIGADFQAAALRWREENLPTTNVRREAERLAGDRASATAAVAVHSGTDGAAGEAGMFFTQPDAIWLRQQLSRWKVDLLHTQAHTLTCPDLTDALSLPSALSSPLSSTRAPTPPLSVS